MAGTSISGIDGRASNLWDRETDPDNLNLVISAKCKGVPPTTANVFAVGCVILQTDGTAGSNLFVNTGTSAAPVFTVMQITLPIVHTPVAVNATATLTAAQVATGYITSTSAAATTMTMPTGTILGAAIGAVQGTTLDLYVDNTAGANTVTVAVAVNGILNAIATAASASFGLLTVPSGVTGQARFTLVFSSATAYSFARTA